jgi:hypothetical protein
VASLEGQGRPKLPCSARRGDAHLWRKHFNGGIYARTFSRLLDENELGEKVLGKDTRAALLFCMEHLEDIEKWRDTLTEHERMQWNSPLTVMRKYKARDEVPQAEQDAAEDGQVDAVETEGEDDEADEDEAEFTYGETDTIPLAHHKEVVARYEERLDGVDHLNKTLLKENERLRRSRSWDAKMTKVEIADAILFDLAEQCPPELADDVIAEIATRRAARVPAVEAPKELPLSDRKIGEAAEQQTAAEQAATEEAPTETEPADCAEPAASNAEPPNADAPCLRQRRQQRRHRSRRCRSRNAAGRRSALASLSGPIAISKRGRSIAIPTMSAP